MFEIVIVDNGEIMGNDQTRQNARIRLPLSASSFLQSRQFSSPLLFFSAGACGIVRPRRRVLRWKNYLASWGLSSRLLVGLLGRHDFR